MCCLDRSSNNNDSCVNPGKTNQHRHGSSRGPSTYHYPQRCPGIPFYTWVEKSKCGLMSSQRGQYRAGIGTLNVGLKTKIKCCCFLNISEVISLLREDVYSVKINVCYLCRPRYISISQLDSQESEWITGVLLMDIILNCLLK